jgi:mannose-6-phosphate isomerase-like protein (cupin superfamily)
MRNVLLMSFLLVGVITMGVYAQAPAAPAQQKPAPAPATQKPATPAPATPAPATQKPAATTPAPRRAPAASTRSGMAITVTSPQGTTISGVQVALMGPTERGGETDAGGQVNFPGLQAGTYRLRFSGDKVTTFEKEVVVRAGQIADVDVALSPAPEPKVIMQPAPAPPPVAAATTGPKGQPVTHSIGDLLEKEYVGKQPRRETLLSCSGNERAAMIQLNEPMPERLYENADAIYYVLGGEGTLMLDGKETKLGLNGFASVPRGTPHSFSKRGGRLLVLLSVLSGEPCEQAR